MQILPDYNLARYHFEALTREEQKDAIYRLADSGFSDHGIAQATRLSVEMIREILAERAGAT